MEEKKFDEKTWETFTRYEQVQVALLCDILSKLTELTKDTQRLGSVVAVWNSLNKGIEK